MSRRVKQVLWGAIAIMFAVAIVSIVWRLQLPAPEAAKLRPRPLGPLILVSIPAILAGMLVISLRTLDARIPGRSQDNTRHVQGAMVFAFFFMVACQGWIAFMYAGGVVPGGEMGVRGAVVLAGVAMAVRGNFMGKLSAPAVADPPDPATWGRTARRMGLSLVVVGSLLAICAMTLPLRPLFFVLMAAALILVGISITHRSATKRAQRP